MDKCRRCERMCVNKVNKDYSRGTGVCNLYLNVLNEKNGLVDKFFESYNRIVDFSKQACRYFVPRKSTLEVGQGGGKYGNIRFKGVGQKKTINDFYYKIHR